LIVDAVDVQAAAPEVDIAVKAALLRAGGAGADEQRDSRGARHQLASPGALSCS
jgi:hypothetical protein